MAKQSGGNTAQRVEALVRPTVEGMGLRLWDVVFEKEGPDWYLRVLIDKTDGIAFFPGHTDMDVDTFLAQQRDRFAQLRLVSSFAIENQ